MGAKNEHHCPTCPTKRKKGGYSCNSSPLVLFLMIRRTCKTEEKGWKFTEINSRGVCVDLFCHARNA